MTGCQSFDEKGGGVELYFRVVDYLVGFDPMTIDILESFEVNHLKETLFKILQSPQYEN